MAKVVVTGAAGFVGRALARALNDAGHGVTALIRADGDVGEAATWARLAAAEHVFHLAARSYVPDSFADPAGFIAANVGGTTRALEYCRQHGAHLVFASTSLFGIPERLPVREDDSIPPNTPYALSKFLAEQTCAFYARAWQVPVTVLRPFNVFGPGQRGEFLIPLILDQVRAGGEIRLKALAPRRDFIFLDDAVDAFMATLAAPQDYRVLNVGSGVSHSAQEVVDTIQRAAGTQLPVISEEATRPGEIPDVRADISRAREVLGWAPKHTFEQGIARLVAAEG
jgi:GDP-4-dehydro-6-deoxy-D-mannose reductase